MEKFSEDEQEPITSNGDTFNLRFQLGRSIPSDSFVNGEQCFSLMTREWHRRNDRLRVYLEFVSHQKRPFRSWGGKQKRRVGRPGGRTTTGDNNNDTETQPRSINVVSVPLSPAACVLRCWVLPSRPSSRAQCSNCFRRARTYTVLWRYVRSEFALACRPLPYK